MSFTRGELIDFEHLCDDEGITVADRVAIIRDLFGQEDAERFINQRGKTLTFPGAQPPPVKVPD